MCGLVLDKTIDEAAEILRDYYSIDEYGDPSVQSQVRPQSNLDSQKRSPDAF